jgi:Sulfotransferase family
VQIVPGRLRRVVRRVIGGPNVGNPRLSPPTPTPAPVADLNVAMIVGAQRSGTTWLQLLCAAHPKIAGSEELHLFSRYVGHVVAAYYNDRRQYAEAGRSQGLPTLLTRDEFDGIVKQFPAAVFSKLLRCKPGAELAIEKTPDHVLHLHYIRHLFPKLKAIHVIRDPRDVVVSQLAAAATWGEDWAPKTPAEAAQRWVDWVTTGRKYAGSDTYTEVRYEALSSDGPRELARVYDFLGYPLPMTEVERIYEQFTMANIKAGKAPNVLVIRREQAPPPAAAKTDGAKGEPGKPKGAKTPEGFYRKGKAGGWRESLSDEDVRAVEEIAGPLMKELGYLRAAELESPATAQPAAAAHA